MKGEATTKFGPRIIRPLIKASDVNSRVRELAERISIDFAGQQLVIIGILAGAVQFMTDLVRDMPEDFAIGLLYDFVGLNSYNATQSTGTPIISSNLSIEVADRGVLLVDGIVDTGHTMQTAISLINDADAGCIKTCTFLDKQARRKVPVVLDYVGYEIEDVFVVGYGMDYSQRYRALPYIGTIDA